MAALTLSDLSNIVQRTTAPGQGFAALSSGMDRVRQVGRDREADRATAADEAMDVRRQTEVERYQQTGDKLRENKFGEQKRVQALEERLKAFQGVFAAAESGDPDAAVAFAKAMGFEANKPIDDALKEYESTLQEYMKAREMVPAGETEKGDGSVDIDEGRKKFEGYGKIGEAVKAGDMRAAHAAAQEAGIDDNLPLEEFNKNYQQFMQEYQQAQGDDVAQFAQQPGGVIDQILAGSPPTPSPAGDFAGVEGAAITARAPQEVAAANDAMGLMMGTPGGGVTVAPQAAPTQSMVAPVAAAGGVNTHPFGIDPTAMAMGMPYLGQPPNPEAMGTSPTAVSLDFGTGSPAVMDPYALKSRKILAETQLATQHLRARMKGLPPQEQAIYEGWIEALPAAAMQYRDVDEALEKLSKGEGIKPVMDRILGRDKLVSAEKRAKTMAKRAGNKAEQNNYDKGSKMVRTVLKDYGYYKTDEQILGLTQARDAIASDDPTEQSKGLKWLANAREGGKITDRDMLDLLGKQNLWGEVKTTLDRWTKGGIGDIVQGQLVGTIQKSIAVGHERLARIGKRAKKRVGHAIRRGGDFGDGASDEWSLAYGDDEMAVEEEASPAAVAKPDGAPAGEPNSDEEAEGLLKKMGF
jgi:hypothetical protein